MSYEYRNPYENTYQPDGGAYEMPSQTDTYGGGDAGKDFLKGFGPGLMSGNPGAGIIMGLITLVGGLISGMTRRDPPLSPEQRAYKDMINYYKKVGERMKVVNSYKRTMIPNRAKNIPVKTDWDGVVSTFPYNGGT